MEKENIMDICKYFKKRSDRDAFIEKFKQAGGELVLLEELDIRYQQLESEQVEWLLKFNKSVVKKFRIIGDMELDTVLKAIKECEVLSKITLMYSVITGRQLEYIVNKSKSLTDLHIAGCYKLKKEKLMSAIECNNNIVKLHLHGLPGVDDEVLLACTQIQHLEFGKVDITGHGLMTLLRYNKKITHLGVHEIKLSSNEVNAIAEMLEQRQQAVEITIDEDLKKWINNHYNYEFVKITFKEKF